MVLELYQLGIDQANEDISSFIEERPRRLLVGYWSGRTVYGHKVEEVNDDEYDDYSPASDEELNSILNGGNATLEESLDYPIHRE